MDDNRLEFDVLIVGAGPAGLSFAIRLAQQCQQLGLQPSIAILEKGANVGSHTLSGALLETSALELLFPDWQQLDLPTHGTIQSEELTFLGKKHALPLPLAGPLKNSSNTPIVSLTHLCRWLAEQAQSLGVEIFPGFSGHELLFNPQGEVSGVRTGPMGLDSQNKPTSRYQPGVEIWAQTTVLAEGCHGSLSQQAIAQFKLRDPETPQTYGLGIREVWQIAAHQHHPGHVQHTLGWPLEHDHYGGGFIYHIDDNQVIIGLVMALDYRNPTFDPHATMQQFKTHPRIARLLEGGTRRHYGARALVEGGLQSLPQLHFPGGLMVGDSAGFLNTAKLKGIHTAMHSGIIAADALAPQMTGKTAPDLSQYQLQFNQSTLYKELHQIRNIRPGFAWGQILGLLHAAYDYYLLRGQAPWTLKHHHDHRRTFPRGVLPKIDYPKPDGQLTFDKPSSLFLSHTQHEEQQPCHLVLKQPTQAIALNWQVFGSPEQYYCPAGVYEIIDADHNPQLRIHASNCLHCKTCAIKDPGQNIVWQTPQGGEGPHYDD